MTFLNPAVLIGLLATSIPIVLHFLNLRKLKQVEFSTLIFLKELQKTKIRRIKLKQLLLLLIRILIIIFLVLAFSRPTLKETTFGTNSTAKTSAVIIIDNTFSMSLVTEKGSLLNQSKVIAKNLLSNLKEGDDVSIISVGNLNQKKFLPTTNLSEAQKQIEDIEISEISFTINQALIEAAKIFYQSKNFNKEIFMITDRQKSRLFNSEEELSNFGKIFLNNTRLFLIDLSNDGFANLGIEDFLPENQIFELGKEISFTATIKNYSSDNSSNNVVSLFVNGKRNAQKNISLKGNETKSVNLETTLQDTGLVKFSVELEDDNILYDNQKYYSIYIPNEISVLILSDNYDDSQFIKYVIGLNPRIKLTEALTSQISSLNFKKYDLIFLIGTEKISNVSKINSYLADGGNLILFPSSQSGKISFSNFCKSIGINNQLDEVGKANNKESIMEFSDADFNHPLLKNIFLEKIKTKIESPEIFKYFRFKNSGKEKNIIRFLDNSPFLFETQQSKSKILVFTSAPSLSWNDFPLKSFFAPIINKIVYYYSIKLNEEKYFVGDEINIDLSKSISSQITIKKPNGLKELTNVDSLKDKTNLTYKNTQTKGVYEFYSSEKLLSYADLNVDPRESLQDKFSTSEFEDYLKRIEFQGKFFNLEKEDDFNKTIYESRFGTELWKYFLFIVLILAVAESLIARNTKKDLTNFNTK